MDAAEIIISNINNEGVFRKSGAVSRQKEIKVRQNIIVFIIKYEACGYQTANKQV